MKYHIDTIPVWDAVREKPECPFCLLERKLEQKYTDFYLSDAIMQSHVRVRTNLCGFCANHGGKMRENDSKLALGLVYSTHAEHILSKLKRDTETLISETSAIRKKDKALQSTVDYLSEVNESCVICEDIERDMARYIYTYLYLFKSDDADFKNEMKSSKGYCLRHYLMLLRGAKEHLDAASRSEFVSIAADVETRSLTELTDDVKHFCEKFDYRNGDKPWGNSKDSIRRMTEKFGGK